MYLETTLSEAEGFDYVIPTEVEESHDLEIEISRFLYVPLEMTTSKNPFHIILTLYYGH